MKKIIRAIIEKLKLLIISRFAVFFILLMLGLYFIGTIIEKEILGRDVGSIIALGHTLVLAALFIVYNNSRGTKLSRAKIIEAIVKQIENITFIDDGWNTLSYYLTNLNLNDCLKKIRYFNTEIDFSDFLCLQNLLSFSNERWIDIDIRTFIEREGWGIRRVYLGFIWETGIGKSELVGLIYYKIYIPCPLLCPPYKKCFFPNRPFSKEETVVFY